MKKKYFLLIFLFFQGLWAFSQRNSNETLSLTLSTTLDTFDANEYYIKKLYEVDTFFKIIIKNIGKKEAKLPAYLGPSYESEPSEVGDYYFRTYWDSNSRIVPYNKQTADIDYIYNPEMNSKTKVLKPSEAITIYDNPLTIHGVLNGINKVYVEAYLRFGVYTIKSNRISVISIYKEKQSNKK